MKDIILQDVLDYILKCKDNETLSTISSAIKDKRKYNASHLKYELQIGDKVRVKGTNRIEDGIIDKVKISRAVVTIDGRKWDVPFTMISKEVSNG